MSDWPANASASATPNPINACCFIESLQKGNGGKRDYIGSKIIRRTLFKE
jgi:hypothetical protein